MAYGDGQWRWHHRLATRIRQHSFIQRLLLTFWTKIDMLTQIEGSLSEDNLVDYDGVGVDVAFLCAFGRRAR